MPFRLFIRQISVRLSILLVILLVAAFATFGWLNYSVHREHLERRTLRSAQHSSELILRATRHAMMRNQRSRVDEIISAISAQEQVRAVRIYNKRGEVVVSTNRDELGASVDPQTEACATCHTEGDLTKVVDPERLSRTFVNAAGEPVVGVITPVRNEPDCSAADCHAHPPGRNVLGVLDVQFCRTEDLEDLATSRGQMVREAVIVSLLTALVAGLFIFFVVGRPVHRLIRGTKAVARLDLDPDLQLDDRSKNEIGVLARNFKHMLSELRRAQAKNDEWAATLEARVEQKTRELQRAQAHLIQVEKMASLGKLSATVAHEINNPLASVLTYARLIARRLKKETELTDEERARLLEHLSVVDTETRRCGDIVKNMLLFSRRKPEGLAEVPIRSVVEKAARLLMHGMEMAGVAFEFEVPEDLDDRVLCNADRMEQMMVALMVNATEAMPEGGRLRVAISTQGKDAVVITVADSGSGIPENIVPRIFEPFFTTKDDEGESGVGLGLAVVHGIVRNHGGEISVKSAPNEGTEFRIVLPRKGAAEAAEASEESLA